MIPISRGQALFGLIALLGAFAITRGLIAQPGYALDPFYYLNAANRLVSGQGLTDAYLWTYIGAPDHLPAPSHLYWMPLTSLIAALGMWVFNAPGNYAAAQFPFTLMFTATVCLGYWLGGRLGKTPRQAWVAGLLTLFSGFFVRFWGETDTFAPYALVGSLCLVGLGLGAERRQWQWFVFAGAMVGLGHLTRADGLLLPPVGWIVILWMLRGQTSLACVGRFLAAFTLAYLVVSLPWFIRNLNEVGTILPVGGTQSIWFSEYNDLFLYPPNASPQTLLASGMLLSSRWEALINNFGTFVAVEGMVALMPFMLIGLWRRRGQPFLRGVWLYALGLHLAMTLVFPYPGYRGGLLHSAAALVPCWAALGVVGLDDAVDWIARYRRRWKPRRAKVVFSAGLVLIAAGLSLSMAAGGRVNAGKPGLYVELQSKLPPDARVMINDPAELYYFTGLGGVVLPNNDSSVIPEIARRYNVRYLLLEQVTPDGIAHAATTGLETIPAQPPDFLTPIPITTPNVRLYEIRF